MDIITTTIITIMVITLEIQAIILIGLEGMRGIILLFIKGTITHIATAAHAQTTKDMDLG